MYVAASLNGKIAKLNGDVAWLNEIPNPENEDFGFADFFDSVDTTIQGFNTYKQVLSWEIEFPYKGKKNYVFTRNTELQNTKFVSMVNKHHIEFTEKLKQQSGKNIWLIGGGQINTLLLNNHLVDEIKLFVMPIILNEGINLFEKIPNETKLGLIETKDYPNGVVELHYKVNRS